MKTLRSNTVTIVLLAMTAAALGSFPASANADEGTRWQVKHGVVLVDSSDTFAIDKPSGGQVHAGGNAGLGLSIAIEYRLSDLIGLEASALFAQSPDIEDSVNANNDEIGDGPVFVPVMAGMNFHLVDNEKVSLYVGPRVAFVTHSNFDLDIDGQNTEFVVDDEFAWGATVGFNYRLGESRWALIAEATYLDVDMTVSEKGTDTSFTSEFNPVMFNLGASFKF